MFLNQVYITACIHSYIFVCKYFIDGVIEPARVTSADFNSADVMSTSKGIIHVRPTTSPDVTVIAATSKSYSIEVHTTKTAAPTGPVTGTIIISKLFL